MARRIIAFVLAAAWLVLGLGALPGSGLHGSAYAQDAAKKIKSIEANVKAARESAETDKLVEGYCNMAWAGIKNIRKNYSSDKSAMDAAAKALEACNFEIPVAYFGKRLEATRCDTFITKARNYFEGFGVFALGIFGKAKPEQQKQLEATRSRFEAALSGRVTKVCPVQAKAQGFGSGPPSASGQQQGVSAQEFRTAYNAELLKNSVKQIDHWLAVAWEGVEKGKLNARACPTILSKATGINKNLSDDEAAMKTAAAAIEACAFELPVASFSARLDSMEANPGDGAACDSFMADVRSHFETVAYGTQGMEAMMAMTMENESSDEERRFKSALSDRVTKACPAQAKAQGY